MKSREMIKKLNGLYGNAVSGNNGEWVYDLGEYPDPTTLLHTLKSLTEIKCNVTLAAKSGVTINSDESTKAHLELLVTFDDFYSA